MGTSANRYKLRLTSGEKYINFPLELTHTNISQEEIVETEFVKKETEKAINPIVDYDTIRYIPHIDRFDVGRIYYKLNLLNENGQFPETTTLETEGFTNEDILFRRNNFKRSFLNLMFFDSDVSTDQNYIGNVTLYNRIYDVDINSSRTASSGGGRVSSGRVETPDRTAPDSDGEDSSDGGSRGGDRSENISEDSFNETRCQDVEATFDDTVKDGLFIGHRCVSIAGYGTSIFRYYLNGFKIGYVVQNNLYGGIPDCDTDGEIGERLSTEEADLNIEVPYSFLASFRKLPETHIHDGKTYEVFVRWESNLLLGDRKISGVFLRCIAGGSAEGESGADNAYVPVENQGQVKDVAEIPLRFIVDDPIEFPKGNAEGFHIYHPKITLPESIYMRANYNNAKTGLSTDLMTTPEPQNISDVLSKIHMKYDLKFDNDKYYYVIDTEYSSNIIEREPLRPSSRRGGEVGSLTIELYEIQVL